MGKRLNLKMYRVSQDLTQEQMAGKIGVPRLRYLQIENGTRDGLVDFWQKLQIAFDLSGEEVWNLQKKA